MPKSFPVYFDDEEEKTMFQDLAKNRRLSLNELIKQSLYAAKENPQFLNPTTDKTDIDVLLTALEKSAQERINHNKKFENLVFQRLEILEKGQELLLEKAKISKKEQLKIKDETEYEDIIFE